MDEVAELGESGLVIQALRHCGSASAKQIAKLIREAGIDFRRTDANHCLYRLERIGIVEKTSDPVPLWSLFESEDHQTQVNAVDEFEPQNLENLLLDILGLLTEEE